MNAASMSCSPELKPLLGHVCTVSAEARGLGVPGGGVVGQDARVCSEVVVALAQGDALEQNARTPPSQ
jgi:hypothetical protein